MIPSPKSVELNSSTFKAITLAVNNNRVNNKLNPVSVYTSDASAWYIATDDAGTDAVLIPPDKVYNNTSVEVDSDTGVMFYAKSLAGSPDLVVLLGLGE